jgi:hypothetical protein
LTGLIGSSGFYAFPEEKHKGLSLFEAENNKHNLNIEVKHRIHRQNIQKRNPMNPVNPV